MADVDRVRLRRDYERLVLSGVKRVVDETGRELLDGEQRAALDRLVPTGLAALEGPAFVLRSVRDTSLECDEETREVLDTLNALWLRFDDDVSSGDEILYGEVGYWQHWWNAMSDGTDRTQHPLRVDLMLPEHGGFLSRQWSKKIDPEIFEHVFSQHLLDARVILPPATRGSNAEDFVEAVVARGVQVRVFSSTSEFSIYDNAAAVVRDEQHPDELERHRLTRRRSMVEPLMHLFEVRWAAAIPWESFVRGSGGILELMARGWKDQRIAEAIGVSPRTVSRRVSEMMAAAGVHSRFELGMKFALQELGPDFG